MEQITEKQATLFVKAGIFPKTTETASIIRLQDMFGHLPYKFVNNLLVDSDEEVRNNALRLYKTIWDETQVNSIVALANKYINDKKELRSVKRRIEELQAREKELLTSIKDFEV